MVQFKKTGRAHQRARKWAVEGETVYLREWLEALGIKAAKLAAAADVNEGYVSQIVNREKHDKRPSTALVQTLAHGLDMPWTLLYEPPPRDPLPMDQIAKYPPALLQRLARARQRAS